MVVVIKIDDITMVRSADKRSRHDYDHMFLIVVV